MRFIQVSILSIVISMFLSACWLDGSGGTAAYDGVWNVHYSDPATIPVVASPTTVGCVDTRPSLTLAAGSGSTLQTQTCTIETPAVSGVSAAVTTTQITDFLISVAIAGDGTTNAIVNGNPLTGKCISTQGCAAQSGTKTLSLTR